MMKANLEAAGEYAAGDMGSWWLYFGCRNEAKDFYYRQQWEDLVKEGRLLVRAAFSRDQDRKVYVTHRLREDAPQLWNLLQQVGNMRVSDCS